MERRKQQEEALERFSKKYHIPPLTLKAIIRMGFLTSDLDTDDDQKTLRMLDKIFTSEDTMRPVLKKYSVEKRRRMLSLMSLSPSEKYVYEKYMECPPNQIVKKSRILIDLEKLFNLPATDSVIAMVKRIRSRAHMDRSRGVKIGVIDGVQETR